MNYLKFVVVSGLTEISPYDVICFQSYDVHEAYLEWLQQKPWISSINVSLEDARKLVHNHHGIGIGCYTPDEQIKLTAARKQMSDMKLASFVKMIGHFKLDASYEFEKLLEQEQIPRAKLN